MKALIALLVVLVSQSSARPVASSEDQPQKFGTVLFTPKYLLKRSWTMEELAALYSRWYFHNIIPPPAIPMRVNDTYFYNHLKNYKDIFLTLTKNTRDPIKRSILTAAFADTVGGHIKARLLPAAKYAFYGGAVSYETVKNVKRYYDEIRSTLQTDGHKWQGPNDDVYRAVLESLPHVARSRRVSEDECKRLPFYNKIEAGYVPPVPQVDWNRSATLYLPIKSGPANSLRSNGAARELQLFYELVSGCLETNPGSLRKFQQRFKKWLESDVVPHLNDDFLYPGLFGVLCRSLPSDVIDEGEVGSRYYGMPRTASIVFIILLVELMWCAPAMYCAYFVKGRLSLSKEGEDVEAQVNNEKDEKAKKSFSKYLSDYFCKKKSRPRVTFQGKAGKNKAPCEYKDFEIEFSSLKDRRLMDDKKNFTKVSDKSNKIIIEKQDACCKGLTNKCMDRNKNTCHSICSTLKTSKSCGTIKHSYATKAINTTDESHNYKNEGDYISKNILHNKQPFHTQEDTKIHRCHKCECNSAKLRKKIKQQLNKQTRTTECQCKPSKARVSGDYIRNVHVKQDTLKDKNYLNKIEHDCESTKMVTLHKNFNNLREVKAVKNIPNSENKNHFKKTQTSISNGSPMKTINNTNKADADCCENIHTELQPIKKMFKGATDKTVKQESKNKKNRDRNESSPSNVIMIPKRRRICRCAPDSLCKLMGNAENTNCSTISVTPPSGNAGDIPFLNSELPKRLKDPQRRIIKQKQNTDNKYDEHKTDSDTTTSTSSKVKIFLKRFRNRSTNKLSNPKRTSPRVSLKKVGYTYPGPKEPGIEVRTDKVSKNTSVTPKFPEKIKKPVEGFKYCLQPKCAQNPLDSPRSLPPFLHKSCGDEIEIDANKKHNKIIGCKKSFTSEQKPGFTLGKPRQVLKGFEYCLKPYGDGQPKLQMSVAEQITDDILNSYSISNVASFVYNEPQITHKDRRINQNLDTNAVKDKLQQIRTNIPTNNRITEREFKTQATNVIAKRKHRKHHKPRKADKVNTTEDINLKHSDTQCQNIAIKDQLVGVVNNAQRLHSNVRNVASPFIKKMAQTNEIQGPLKVVPRTPSLDTSLKTIYHGDTMSFLRDTQSNSPLYQDFFKTNVSYHHSSLTFGETKRLVRILPQPLATVMNQQDIQVDMSTLKHNGQQNQKLVSGFSSGKSNGQQIKKPIQKSPEKSRIPTSCGKPICQPVCKACLCHDNEISQIACSCSKAKAGIAEQKSATIKQIFEKFKASIHRSQKDHVIQAKYKPKDFIIIPRRLVTARIDAAWDDSILVIKKKNKVDKLNTTL